MNSISLRLVIISIIAACYASDAQSFVKRRCYFKVDFKLEGQQILTDRIACFTQETAVTDGFKTELRTGDLLTDSSITFTRYFMLGKKRKLKRYASAHIILQLFDRNGEVIQKIDGEILREDWECH